jgi:nucleoside-diphosphate-sugar epimerase
MGRAVCNGGAEDGDFRMKRILVTGASGFIGRHVLPLLADRGWDVHAVSWGVPTIEMPGVRWYECNLFDTEEIGKITKEAACGQLLHLAWYTEPGKYWTSPENFRWLRASMDILDAFYRAGGTKVVCAGTCAEYDWNYGYCREDITPLAPATAYGKCKHILHQILTAYGETNKLQVTWGRVFFLYGPFEAPGRLVPSIAAALLQGKEAHCTHGEYIRDYLHVRDVAAAFVSLVSSDAQGAFNIGSSHPIPVREIAEQIAGELGAMHLLHMDTMPEQSKEPPLIVADNRRLLSLGWRPEFSLGEGISDTLDWWKKQVKIS